MPRENDDLPRRRDDRRDRDDDRDDDRRRDRDDRGDRRDRGDRPKDLSVLGLLSLIQGGGALIASFIPCFGVFAMIGAFIGLILGVTGIVVAKNGKKTGMGLPIAGTVVNTLALLIAAVWLLVIGAFMGAVANMPPPTFNFPPPPTFPTDTTPTTEPTPTATGKFVTRDLTEYGIRAVIDVPEGAVFKHDYTTKIVFGNNAELRFSTSGDDIAAEKAKIRAEGGPKLLADLPDGFYSTSGRLGASEFFKMAKDLTIGDEKHQVTGHLWDGKGTRATADIMWQSARSFRQTDAQKKAEGLRTAAVKKLAEFDIEVRSWVTLRGDKPTDAVIPLLAAVPDVRELTIEDAPKLTAAALPAIAKMTYLRSLKLEGPRFTDASLAALTPMPGLEKLTLEKTPVTDAGLAAVPAGMPNLTEFTITDGRTPLSDAGVKPLAGLTKLKRLAIHRSRITGPGLAPLAGLAKLENVFLYETAVDDAGLAFLAGKPNLKGVFLGRTRVTGTGLKHLAGAKLDELDLSGCPVTDAGLAGLAGLRIDRLKLTGTGVGDAGAGHISKTVGLKWLALGNTRVGDAGLASLAKIPTLETLELDGSDVTGATAGDLKNCPNLRYVGVADAPFTDAGCAALARLPKLESITLDGTEVTDAGLRAFAAVPADRAFRVNAENPWQFSAAAVDALKAARPKFVLPKTAPAEPAPKALKPVVAAAGLPKPDPAAMYKKFDITPTTDDDAPGKPVVGLSLGDDKITDRDVAEIRDLKTVKYLYLSAANVTDAGLAHLAGLTALESISIRSDKVTDSGLAVLAKLPALQSVDITSKAVAGDGFVYLKGLSKLKTVNLGGAAYFPRHLAPLGEIPTLESVSLGSENEGSPHGAALYAKLPKVKSLSLFRPTPAVVRAVAAAKGIEDLRITTGGNFGNGPISARVIAPLGGMKSLRQLTLEGKVDDRGLEAIAGLTGLESLDVRWAERVTDAGFRHAGKMSGLKYLTLKGGAPTADGIAALAGIKQLESLDLATSPIDDAGVAAAVKLPALTRLTLYGATRVTDASVPALGAAKTLQRVGLNGSGVTLAGVKKLREANPELTVEYPEPEKPEDK